MGLGGSLALGAMGGSLVAAVAEPADRLARQGDDRRRADQAALVRPPARRPAWSDRAGFVQLSPDLWARSDQAAIVGSPDIVAALDPLPIDRLTARRSRRVRPAGPRGARRDVDLRRPARSGRVSCSLRSASIAATAVAGVGTPFITGPSDGPRPRPPPPRTPRPPPRRRRARRSATRTRSWSRSAAAAP